MKHTTSRLFLSGLTAAGIARYGGPAGAVTALHVSSSTATGSDPVLLNDSNTFTITEVGNHDISSPLRVYFIEPLGAALPTITGASGVGSGGSFSFGPTATATARAFDTTNNLFDGPVVTISSTQGLGKQLN